jgi:hypothetical protein
VDQLRQDIRWVMQDKVRSGLIRSQRFQAQTWSG